MAFRTIAAAEARERLHELVRDVGTVQKQYVITRKDRPAAVLLNYEEYQKMMEKVYGARVSSNEVLKKRGKR